ncbi:MAG: diphosphate--fructose-6-phosphate 1-phosphotransferase [Prevotellaceae bacterium]|jgi:pyrophosphate--fructose-6-phosphate 1-phosphotransferase|nr:diphosphate--fructose-6-phosphate 1-phosphotransferase [Prevotellaceae bacterium]
MNESPLQTARYEYQPKTPDVLRDNVMIRVGEPTESIADRQEIQRAFPNTYGSPLVYFEKSAIKIDYPQINVGVILSGGQAPGGHNVIAGLFDSLKKLNSNNRLYGFLGGPGGLIEHQYKELTANIIDAYRNTGGFDIIGSGRTKLETEEQFESGLRICEKLNIKAIVIIGGDDSNTNACILAEYYMQKGSDVQIIGCPKTIDGDLKNEMIETSFGFDTACKVYSELIGNIQRDAGSARKYWHFIRLMGRSASHITLECSLLCQPNITIVSEEVEAKNFTLNDIVEDIAVVIAKRADAGLNFGTILIPEGLLEFISAIKKLIAELNDLLADNNEILNLNTNDQKYDFITKILSEENKKTFFSLPKAIALQLSLDRDSHGNVQVSLIETEKLLIEMVGKRLEQMKSEGKYKGKFSSVNHFFGYEGRCASPSNFDADYCYSLGVTASLLVVAGKTGYMASIKNLTAHASKWLAGGVPITMMFNMEKKSGKLKPVIQKALVNLDGEPFKFLQTNRELWASAEDTFVYPGAIQYFGPSEVCDKPTRTLLLESR